MTIAKKKKKKKREREKKKVSFSHARNPVIPDKYEHCILLFRTTCIYSIMRTEHALELGILKPTKALKFVVFLQDMKINI